MIGLVATPALAADYYSPSKVTNLGENTLAWTGQGASGGELDEELCDGELPEGIEPGEGYLLWIFTYDNGETEAIEGQTPYLVLGGTGSGTYYPTKHAGNEFHFVTPYFTPNSSLTAVVYFNTTDTGNGKYNLTISHGCSGGGGGPEAALTVTKTAVTSYTRTHEWSIEKSVDTENGYTEDGSPKIWLYIPGQEGKDSDDKATWTVDVTYEGFTDSDFNVSGDITIENTGDVPVEITDVSDVLGDAVIPITVTWGITFPYTIAVGETITGSYSEDVESMIEGYNVATVTTSLLDGENDPIEFHGYAEIEWGDPTTEYYKTITVEDVSDLFGTVTLGTVTAPNDAQFTYTKDFDWADYGKDACGDYTYDNTATIVETGQSASATLLVNVQCYIYETAYAKGSSGPVCFISQGFSNWGWTNPITAGTYVWDLWAGAGQCDTTKATLVGSVTVVYSGGYVTVTYNVNSPYLLKNTHVYAGTTPFPQVLQGKKLVNTVAPGQYYNNGGFGGQVYVIAQAEVGIPDPNFGP
jgi:hypothetical protein